MPSTGLALGRVNEIEQDFFVSAQICTRYVPLHIYIYNRESSKRNISPRHFNPIKRGREWDAGKLDPRITMERISKWLVDRLPFLDFTSSAYYLLFGNSPTCFWSKEYSLISSRTIISFNELSQEARFFILRIYRFTWNKLILEFFQQIFYTRSFFLKKKETLIFSF